MVVDMEVEHDPATENLELVNDEETPALRRCPNINIQLLPYKCFYFLFYSATGSLFPYLAIFYKQMWLSPQKTGILIGIQPLLQLASNPVWGMIADRSGKGKMIFFIALVAWLCSNFSLSLVKHPLDLGPCNENGTRITLKGDTLRVNTETTERNSAELDNSTSNTRTTDTNLSWAVREENRNKNKAAMKQSGTIVKQNRSTGNNAVYHETVGSLKEKKEQKFEELSALGHSPWPLNAITSFEAGAETATSRREEADGTFFMLLFIIVVGNLVASPAVPFADSATLQALGDNLDFYGKQRQWGAIGWGASSFAVGSVVSTLQEKSHCDVPSHVNYKPCFYAFAVFMMAAFVPALFFQFRFEDRNGSGMNASGTMRTLLSIDWLTFLATVLFFGWSLGLLRTFLLWHLQDLGGTPFLFSIIAATQCFSEVVSYHYAGFVTRMIGYHRAFYVGLLVLSLRLVFYGVIKNPWLVLPIELFHGLSTTLIWSLAVSLVGLNSAVPMTMQGVLSGVYWGLGYGGGSMLSGLLVNTIGSTRTFIAFGIVSMVNFLILVTLRKLKYLDGPSEESRSLLESQANEDYE